MNSSHTCDLLPEGNLDPCTIVIFGASGDLTRRKLIPALYDAFVQGKMPRAFTIVGCSRTILDDEQFREMLARAFTESTKTIDSWNSFAAHLFYIPIEYEISSFEKLAKTLTDLDIARNTNKNKVFDLAVPPALYPVIAELLGLSGLAVEPDNPASWSRIVVEKPFGHNLDSARLLNKTLHNYFKEQQIFRIDHYLAKETVQNVLIFRFANTIFEPIWNRHYIDYVGIIAAEELGVGTRAGFYEQAGVIRDMFQNHMMQLLVLTAMEPPSHFQADAVQDEKAKVIRSLRAFSPKQGSRIYLGQYGKGLIKGEKVIGYRNEKGISPQSLTPTFALMELYLDNWRWQHVPFYLASGKRLPRKETRIVIQFKEVPHQLFKNVFGDTIGANRLIIETYPQESIKLIFQTKNPGTTTCLRSMTMDFVYHEHYKQAHLDAYARVLLDCIAGNHMLFWRQDGIELSWSFLTSVLDECENCSSRDQLLHFYSAGSWGPKQVHKTMGLFFDD